MNRQLLITKDGSHTLYAPELQDHYHSTFGAVQESTHIYIERAFRACRLDKDKVNVLEIGLGTGLNAFLTWQESLKQEIYLEYHALEPYPLNISIAEQLNYIDFVQAEGAKAAFYKMHKAEWGTSIDVSKYMTLVKRDLKVQDARLELEYFDVVYFDAFGPEAQPELWTEKVFRKIFDSMVPGAVMCTFSSKGDVKRAIKSAGFNLELIDGPPGKRTITRAWKK